MTNPFMAEAIKEAYQGVDARDGGPFGCVIVKDGKIIGRGHNQVLLRHDCTCHGEVMAIHDASKNLNDFCLAGCEIYTTAEPCPMCLSAILWARMDKIYYGCSIQDTALIGFCDEEFYNKLSISTKDLDMVQIDHEECLKLFEYYSQIQDRVIY